MKRVIRSTICAIWNSLVLWIRERSVAKAVWNVLSWSLLVRDKVAQILGMIQDNDTMQQERLKARRLKKKFATTKSVGSAPPPPAPSSGFVQSAGSAMKGLFASSSKPAAPAAPAGPSYRVKGGELSDIPVAGQVMKPTSSASATASKLKNNLASFGHKVGGVVSSAAASVSSTVSGVTTSAPVEHRPTPLRNFRDLEDTEEEVAPEPEPEPAPAPVAAPKPAKPKVTRATKEADALFNFGGVACVNTTIPAEKAVEPAPAAPAPSGADFFTTSAPSQPAAPAASGSDFFSAPAAAPAPAATAPAPAPTKPTDAFDFFSDIPDTTPAKPAAPVATSNNAFGGLVDLGNITMPQQVPQQMQQQMPQQMYQQGYQQQTQQQMYQQQMYQQQMYQQQQQRLYQQQMYQQQMYQQQQQRGGYNMQGF